MSLRPLRWEDDVLLMLDQRILPARTDWLRLETWNDVAEAIATMAVRGAPAIGIAAAYGMALAAKAGVDREVARGGLAASRPTAVNLFWALDRIDKVPYEFNAVLAEAMRIESEDLQANQKIGEFGATLIPYGAKVLTICNTGALATSGHGTALGMIRSAHAAGKEIFVYSCETRPRQQGLKLTAYELLHEEIPFRSIVDSAAASLMAMGEVDFVVAGADRIAANGDTANKVGTLSLAVLASHFSIPFAIAAPTSTIDPSLPDGSMIPIEEREGGEITDFEGSPVAPLGTPVYNPGFDVTPGSLIRFIVTEQGVSERPYHFETIP